MRSLRSLLLLAAGMIVAVVAYNIWSVYQGRCACENLLSLNLVTGGLLTGNGIALAAWVFLMRGRGGGRGAALCRCGHLLQDGWSFCGGCGRALASDSQGAEKK